LFPSFLKILIKFLLLSEKFTKPRWQDSPSADKRSVTKNLLAVVLQNMMSPNIFLEGRKCFFADAFYSTVLDYQMLEVLHISM
jgi:hypothetical protein